MKLPTVAEAGRFILIVFAVLLAQLIARIVLFDGEDESLSAINVVIAIAAAVVVMGGWLSRGKDQA